MATSISKIAGAILALVVGVVVFYVVTNSRDSRKANVPAPDSTLGATPATDLTSSARSAKNHVERGACLSNCGTAEKSCTASASEHAAQTSCAAARASCDGMCPP